MIALSIDGHDSPDLKDRSFVASDKVFAKCI